MVDLRNRPVVCGLFAAFCFIGTSAAAAEPPAEIKAAGKMVFCSDMSSPGWSYYDKDGSPKGLDVDIATEVAKRFGVKAEFRNVTFGGLIPALQAKQCSAIISQLFDKPARREVVNFVNYASSAMVIVVPKGNPKKIEKIDDLSGFKVAYENGSTGGSILESENKKFGEKGLPAMTGVPFPHAQEARHALLTSRADALLTSRQAMAAFFKASGPVLDLAGEPFERFEMGIAIRKDDSILYKAVAEAFAELQRDGTYSQLLSKNELEGSAL